MLTFKKPNLSIIPRLVGLSKLPLKIYSHVRTTIKNVRINLYYSYIYDGPIIINLKDKLNEIYGNLIPLINEGNYNRFNSFDYMAKSSKINILLNSLEQLRSYYDMNPNERNHIKKLLNTISNHFPSLERSSDFIWMTMTKNRMTDKQLFILIRNFIASEWIYRNIKGPETKIKRKDLNYLNYNLDQYQEYLHNCLNFLVRDTKKFISRYPEEYKQNPDLDLEILQSLKWTVYNDFRFATPNSYKGVMLDNFEELDLFNLIEKEVKPIVIKGWFRDQPKSDYIDSIKYKEYRRTKGNKSTLEKTLKSFGLKSL